MTNSAYNALPIEVREICAKVILERQILDLHIERDRAIHHHEAHLREIDDHLANCKSDLAKFPAHP